MHLMANSYGEHKCVHTANLLSIRSSSLNLYQSFYSNLFARIDIVDTASPIQPIFHDLSYAIQGYSSRWNFTANKQLLLNGRGDRFYATVLHTDRYNYPTVHWLFGSNTQAINGSPITIWRYP
jgi:hypothetical protein